MFLYIPSSHLHVLSKCDDVHINVPEVLHRLQHFSVSFSEAKHDRRLGKESSRGGRGRGGSGAVFYVVEDAESLAISGSAITNEWRESLHGFDVVGINIKAYMKGKMMLVEVNIFNRTVGALPAQPLFFFFALLPSFPSRAIFLATFLPLFIFIIFLTLSIFFFLSLFHS